MGGEEYDDSKSKSQATSQGDTNDICAAQGNCSPGDQCLTGGCQDNVEGPILNLAFFFSFPSAICLDTSFGLWFLPSFQNRIYFFVCVTAVGVWVLILIYFKV